MKRIKSIAHLLFSFEGRISCKMWWLAKFAVALVIILLLLFVYWESVFYWLRQIVAILTVPWVWSWYVLDVKRLHDRNRAGWWTLLSSICLGIYLLFFTSYEGAFYIQENPGIPSVIICSIYYLTPLCKWLFCPEKRVQTDMGPRRSPSKSGGDLFRDEKRTERWELGEGKLPSKLLKYLLCWCI